MYGLLISHFLISSLKTKQQACEKLLELSRNDDYARGNVLNYSNDQNYYKLIGMHFLRQTNTTNPQQTSFTDILEEDNIAAMFYFVEKRQETVLSFSLDSLIIAEECKQWDLKKYWI